ncbi:27592_t:CDS:2, partial [Racocetra persica]
IKINGVSWNIDNRDIVRNNDQLNGLCAGGFQSGGPSGGWILGLTFLRNVYSIFEQSQDGYGTRVGFATLTVILLIEYYDTRAAHAAKESTNGIIIEVSYIW